MTDTSKYDLFLKELNSLEKMINSFVQKNNELLETKKVLEKKVTQLQNENEVLKLKIDELEGKVEEVLNKRADLIDNNNISDIDREALISHIDDLIERIDYHIRS
ncbi:hypothetical protein BMS3Abin04_01701 [bacterium BMS3Abin04]|nr:hypothetical protein BMS3Abin04_01701 [bacterium BMS3Abin04]